MYAWVFLNPSGVLGIVKNLCPARDLAELGAGSVPRWQEAPQHISREQITQGPLTARRNEAVLLDVFPTTAKGTEPRLSQQVMHSSCTACSGGMEEQSQKKTQGP